MRTVSEKCISNKEDKRILKTRRNLKNTLMRLMGSKRFEEISVTELCAEALTSRITFYAHYDDKYDLLDDVFADVISVTLGRLSELEEQNNPTHNLILSCEHLLTVILDLYAENYTFFSHASGRDNPYLHESLYRRILMALEDYTTGAINENGSLVPRYELRRVIAFLCNGLWAFINENPGGHGGLSPEIRLQARTILHDVLQSGILTEHAVRPSEFSESTSLSTPR